MRVEETRTVTTCDFCGKEIPGDEMQSPETCFTSSDLDGYHGIWMGDVHESYVGSSTARPEKHFCDIECLFNDIRSAYQVARLKNGDMKTIHNKKGA
jgi:hypothetical protein